MVGDLGFLQVWAMFFIIDGVKFTMVLTMSVSLNKSFPMSK